MFVAKQVALCYSIPVSTMPAVLPGQFFNRKKPTELREEMVQAQILPELTEHRLAKIRASHKYLVIEGGIEVYSQAAYKQVALCVFSLEKSQVDGLDGPTRC